MKKSYIIGICAVLVVGGTVGLLEYNDYKEMQRMEAANMERAFGSQPLAVTSEGESEREKELRKSKEEFKERQSEIKENAVLADFEEIYDGNWLSKNVYSQGEVTGTFEKDGTLTFGLFPIDGDAEGTGIYEIFCYPLFDATFSTIKNGDHVKVYGHVDKKNEKTGMPRIYGIMIEKTAEDEIVMLENGELSKGYIDSMRDIFDDKNAKIYMPSDK